MKRFVFIFASFLFSLVYSGLLYAEGLPANPWQNPQKLKATLEKENEKVVEQASAVATDIWNKVRDTKEFRQWSMPENEKESQNTDTQNLMNDAAMIMMLANLNKVGYKVPDNYKKAIMNMKPANVNQRGYVSSNNQNIVRRTPQKSETGSGLGSYERSFNQWKRQLKNKYGNAKNSSLNILDNSYRRALSTIKQSTGVDVNRAINDVVNDSLNAFK